MSTPLISVLHPTARTKPYPPSLLLGWKHTCDAFYRKAKDPSRIEYVISVHESRWEEFWDGPLRTEVPCAKGRGWVWTIQPNPGADITGLWAPPFGSVRVVKNEGRDTNVD